MPVHRGMLLALVGPPPTSRHLALHVDDDPANNTIGNLRWGTAKENAADRDKHGRTGHHERHPNAKFNWDIVRAIRAEPNYRGKGLRLAEKYGVANSLIYGIMNNKIWVE